LSFTSRLYRTLSCIDILSGWLMFFYKNWTYNKLSWIGQDRATGITEDEFYWKEVQDVVRENQQKERRVLAKCH